MSEQESEGTSVIVDFKQKIHLIRMIGNTILASKFTIQAEVAPADEAEEIDFEIAFSKIRFWFNNIISGCVVFCKDNAYARDMMLPEGIPVLTNHIMITPNEPTDEHLAVLFQSKMEALGDDMFEFGQIKMKIPSDGLMFTYVGNWIDDLPEMKDWFSTTPYYFETPWWTRNDISTIDMIIGEFNSEKRPYWADKLDFIEKGIRPNPNKDEIEVTPQEEQHKNTIIKGSFRPKVVVVDDSEKND